jgi:hypothetical protein
MDVGYTRWERRDGADRNALAMAALEYCRAMREENGVSDARFYWSGVDTLSVLAHVESVDILNRLTTPRLAKASFALADLARQTTTEAWFDAHVGEAMYATAQG